MAENRWTALPLWSQTALADFNAAFTKQPGRGSFEAVSTSTWTTGRALATGVLENSATGRSIAWQIEHNGGWRWEVDNIRDGEDSVAVILLGPEDLDHHWSEELNPGESFSSVPVSVAVSTDGFEGAIAELTRHRRWLRRNRDADRGSLLVYNDFNADSIALALRAPDRTFVYVWHRGAEDAELSLHLGADVRARHLVEQYPRTLAPWTATDGPDNSVMLRPGQAGMTARVYEIIQD